MKSDYKRSNQNSYRGAGRTDTRGENREEGTSSTTHYAYRLEKDAEGNVVGKDYINSLKIFENEGKYGNYFKMKVTGEVPMGDVFIAKKKSVK